MSGFLSRLGTFFRELKRRSVFRVVVVYAVVAWMVVQVASLVSPALQLPLWTVTLVVVLGWAFEVTPEDVRLSLISDPSWPYDGSS